MSERRQLPDQEARGRFTTELDRNFSVLAPAGVGKTRAIVDRVVNIAVSPASRSSLSKLAVVTYTNKAADQMQQRARNSLLAHEGGAERMSDFNRAFFGTIHSFCVNILTTYGHYLGLPGSVDMANDADEETLWLAFFRQFNLSGVNTGLSEQQMRKCFRHLPIQHVLELARHVEPGDSARLPNESWPEPDFESVLRFQGKGRGADGIERGKAFLARWKKEYDSGAAFLPLPQHDRGGAEFLETWNTAFAPLRHWLGNCALAVASAVSAQYQQYRISQGKLTYSDQIRFVLELLKHPEAGPLLRAEDYRIVLDEAQDTDPDQFRVLLELARPSGANGIWTDDGGPAPLPGHFCMVGDPQQSIYAARADLAFYQMIRERLVKEASAEELQFHVTFRCNRNIVAAANSLCGIMLNGKDGQVGYVELVPRSGAGEGQVIRREVRGQKSEASPKKAALPQPSTINHQPSTIVHQPSTINHRPSSERLGVNEAAQIEAKDLAAWLKEQGPGKLGAADWSGVAILCARKRWIDPIELALREQGLPVQNHSRREIQGDDPAFAWFTALMVVMAEPWNGYEIVGVLREIFGLSDQELYDFAKGDGKRFQIETKTGGRGPVVDVLNLLHETREKAAQLPILDAVETIIGAARLRERLNAIAGDGSITRTTPLVSKMEGEVPPEPSSGKDMEAERTLATLLSRAASAESERKPFRDWADALKKGYADTRDSPRVKENSIQLMTCHAAKGLEWDAVIIPMMFRPIGRRGSQYPYVYRDRRKGSTVLVFSPEWLAEEADRHIKLAQKQEDQRLLYVAMTRAKKTLVLADDAAISSRTKDSFAECMELTGKKQPETWTALPRQISIQPGAEEEAPAVERIEPIKSLSKQDLAAATKRAHDFPRRILPSALVVHAADAEPEQAWDIDPDWETGADEAGRRYGTWWHGVMEKLDWRNAEAWNAVFEEEILSSPFPDRARKEWALFVNSDIAKTLARPELVIQTEVPFLRKLPDGGCEEGFIDLVACNPVKNEWLVIDWKTNEIRESQLPELRKLYEPQIKEYAAAILSFAGPTASVKALLYSTPRGKTI